MLRMRKYVPGVGSKEKMVRSFMYLMFILTPMSPRKELPQKEKFWKK